MVTTSGVNKSEGRGVGVNTAGLGHAAAGELVGSINGFESVGDNCEVNAGAATGKDLDTVGQDGG